MGGLAELGTATYAAGAWAWAAVAAGLLAAWTAGFGVAHVLTRPHLPRAPADDATAGSLDLPGTEAPAVVNFLTSRWCVGHDAMAATLLDLGARGFVAIETRGDRTVVRLTSEYPAPQLAPHERLVLARVADLAAETADATVPAGALTLGPADLADPAWAAFERAVTGAARWAGLSRPRWSRATRAALIVGAVLVGLAVGAPLANGDPAAGSLAGALAAFAGTLTVVLAIFVVRLGGERDTAAGRAAADRWAGYAATLAEDPLFPDHPAASVAVWDRHLAYAAALGLARTAIETFPLAAESDTDAWSSVGGRWRRVHISYPFLFPPWYGQPPGLVGACGAVLAAAGLVEAVRQDLPLGSAVMGGVGALGLVFVGLAAYDLLTPARVIDGRVLRTRITTLDGSGKRTWWYLAVDDGSRDRLRALRFDDDPGPVQGDRVEAEVTPLLQYVRSLHRRPRPRR